jgi:arginyl-tRNA synthetase
MKFYLLRVDPKKKMVFNPEESIDFHGFTGPFIQYAYARIKSILRKDEDFKLPASFSDALLPLEKKLLFELEQYPQVLSIAGESLDPSVLANYLFQLAKSFNSFYAEHSISNAESTEKKELRLALIRMISNVIQSGMQLLGIRVPERM